MTKKDIITNILRVKELQFNEFAMECGIVPNTLQISINRNALSNGTITKIHNKYRVRKQYLKTGKGEMFEDGIEKTSNITDVMEALIKSNALVIQGLEYKVALFEKQIIELEKEKAEWLKQKKELLKKVSSKK
jgi:dsRNA-specific ribonuclease